MNKEELIKKNEKRFWEKMKQYPYEYDFSKVKYVNANDKVEVVCQKHGSFFIAPKHLVNDQNGCPKCKKEKFRNTIENFKSRVNATFNGKYDLSKFTYVNNKTKGIVICPKHGEFSACPHSLYQGKGCPSCGKITRSKKEAITQDEWIKRFITCHGDKYDYSLVKINGYKTKIDIICKKHGIFSQTPDNHYRGKGCPICNSSKMEDEVRKFLVLREIKFDEQKKFSWLGLQSLDFYLPDYKVGLECQGSQHLGNNSLFDKKLQFEDRIQLDVNKNIRCKQNDVMLLYILDENVVEKSKDEKFCGIYNSNIITRNNLEKLKDILNEIKKAD